MSDQETLPSHIIIWPGIFHQFSSGEVSRSFPPSSFLPLSPSVNARFNAGNAAHQGRRTKRLHAPRIFGSFSKLSSFVRFSSWSMDCFSRSYLWFNDQAADDNLISAIKLRISFGSVEKETNERFGKRLRTLHCYVVANRCAVTSQLPLMNINF